MRVVGVDLELRFLTRGWLPKFISTRQDFCFKGLV